MTIKKRNVFRGDALFKRFCHEFGGERTAGGSSCSLIMVGLITNVFTEIVHGKRYAESHELEETSCGECGICEGDIAVHRAAAHERFRHRVNAIGHTACEIELIKGLLIRARIARGAHHSALGEDRDILHAEIIERIRRIIACGTATNDDGSLFMMRDFHPTECDVFHEDHP